MFSLACHTASDQHSIQQSSWKEKEFTEMNGGVGGWKVKEN